MAVKVTSSTVAIIGVTVTERTELPPVIRQKIAAFLAAGITGQIVLDVKEGRVLAYKLTEAGRVPAVELDRNGNFGQDSR